MAKKKITKKVAKKAAKKKTKEIIDKVGSPPRKSGQPTKFTKAVMIVIGKMTEEGFTNKEICKALEIDEQTFYNWKKEHRAFFESLSDWRKAATYRVEESLFHSCIGTTVKEVRPVVVSIGDYMSAVEYHEYEKHIAPNVTAQKYWLNNRSNDWRDKREHEIKEIQSMDDNDLKAKVAAIMGKSSEEDDV